MPLVFFFACPSVCVCLPVCASVAKKKKTLMITFEPKEIVMHIWIQLWKPFQITPRSLIF